MSRFYRDTENDKAEDDDNYLQTKKSLKRTPRMLGPERMVSGIPLQYPDSLFCSVQRIRASIYGAYLVTYNRAECVSRAYYSKEAHVVSSIASLRGEPHDEVAAGLAGGLLAAMATVVAVRTRTFPVRWLLPPIAGIAALRWTIPNTSTNTWKLIHDMEQQRFPNYTLIQDRAINGATKVVGAISTTTNCVVTMAQKSLMYIRDLTNS